MSDIIHDNLRNTHNNRSIEIQKKHWGLMIMEKENAFAFLINKMND